ncbi:hypothetical protein HQ586_08000 [Candidatus Bathyarchaeota archaeon]|nr:hypothetical protein [Candidatus Bathyarchaeota archaeon]
MLRYALIGIFLFTLAVLVVAIVYPILTARKVRTFQTRVVDKFERNSMIYAGVFVPLVLQYLVVEMGVEMNVRSSDYRNVDIGDTVWVSRYSNGSYRLER